MQKIKYVDNDNVHALVAAASATFVMWPGSKVLLVLNVRTTTQIPELERERSQLPGSTLHFQCHDRLLVVSRRMPPRDKARQC